MDLPSTQADPLNTSLLSPDDSDNRPLYNITTRSPPLRDGTTVITKVSNDKSEKQLAQIEWHSWKADVLRFELREVSGDVRKYVGRVKKWSSTRQFTSASGHQYKWVDNVLKSSSGDELARWNRKYYGLFHKKRAAHLEVSQELLQHVDLDEIIVTWAYCMALIQKRWQATIQLVVTIGLGTGIGFAAS